jgi:hypothetical protein
MHVPYELFLKEHLNYLIVRLMAAEGKDSNELVYSIRRVREILNNEELKKIIAKE